MQKHNEGILDQVYRRARMSTSHPVSAKAGNPTDTDGTPLVAPLCKKTLIQVFSMAGPIRRGEHSVSWKSRRTATHDGFELNSTHQSYEIVYCMHLHRISRPLRLRRHWDTRHRCCRLLYGTDPHVGTITCMNDGEDLPRPRTTIRGAPIAPIPVCHDAYHFRHITPGPHTTHARLVRRLRRQLTHRPPMPVR